MNDRSRQWKAGVHASEPVWVRVRTFTSSWWVASTRLGDDLPLVNAGMDVVDLVGPLQSSVSLQLCTLNGRIKLLTL